MLECFGVTRMTKSLKQTSADGNAAKAVAALLRRAQADGIKPFESLADYAGKPEITADFDVEAFLHEVREDRDRPSNQG